MMTQRRLALLLGSAAALGLPVLARPARADRGDRPPPGSLPASEVMRRVEQRPDFGWLEDFEWDDDGYWEVDYRTPEGRSREIKLDPRTGAERR